MNNQYSVQKQANIPIQKLLLVWILFMFILTYLVPAKKFPLPLPNVETATDNEMITTPALPIVLKPKGYSMHTNYRYWISFKKLHPVAT